MLAENAHLTYKFLTPVSIVMFLLYFAQCLHQFENSPLDAIFYTSSILSLSKDKY